MITTWIGRRYFTAVANSPISIVKPPSPTNATDCRFGYAIFAAIAYGSPGAIVARLPEQENICPRLIEMGRAAHVVIVPESVEMIASSARRSLSAWATTCGLSGISSRCVRVSISSRHAFMPACARSRKARSPRCARSGSSACSVAFASPHRPTSTGKRRPMRVGSRSVCTRHDDRRSPRLGRVSFDVLLRTLVLVEFLVLQIDGTTDVRDAAGRERGAARRVDERACVPGAEDLLVVGGDVLEERQQIDFLLVPHAHEVVVGLPGDGEHRRAIELRVVEAVEQVNGSRAGGGETNAELARVLRVARRHERRRFLVANLNERDALLPDAKRFHDAVDAVARKAEHNPHSPVDQSINEHVGSRLCHWSFSAAYARARSTPIADARGSTRPFR